MGFIFYFDTEGIMVTENEDLSVQNGHWSQ